MASPVLPIGSRGGFHVSNYHKDASTGVTPAAIQAGRQYGPVSFSGHILSGIATPIPNRLGNQIGGYTGNPGSPYSVEP